MCKNRNVRKTHQFLLPIYEEYLVISHHREIQEDERKLENLTHQATCMCSPKILNKRW